MRFWPGILNLSSVLPRLVPKELPSADIRFIGLDDTVRLILCQTLLSALAEKHEAEAPVSSNTLMIVPGLSTSSISIYALLNSLRTFSFTAAIELFRLRFRLISLTVDIAEDARGGSTACVGQAVPGSHECCGNHAAIIQPTTLHDNDS